MIKVEGLCKEFEGNEILKDINLEIEKGEFVAVMGQSGCGKSTLLYNISGMDCATNGKIRFDGKELSALSEKEMEKLRLHKMGFVFQKTNFLKNLSIEDNIIFPAVQTKQKKRSEMKKDAEALMKKMAILETKDKDIRKVSGGQLQRAAICRAMINQPEILFGDEPTGALNSSATKEVMDIINRINAEGRTVMLVTHDAKVAARADRIIYLEDGRIKEELQLGRFESKLQEEREDKMKNWLMKMGF